MEELWREWMVGGWVGGCGGMFAGAGPDEVSGCVASVRITACGPIQLRLFGAKFSKHPQWRCARLPSRSFSLSLSRFLPIAQEFSLFRCALPPSHPNQATFSPHHPHPHHSLELPAFLNTAFLFSFMSSAFLCRLTGGTLKIGRKQQ